MRIDKNKLSTCLFVAHQKRFHRNTDVSKDRNICVHTSAVHLYCATNHRLFPSAHLSCIISGLDLPQFNNRDPNCMNSKYNVMVDCESGDITEDPLSYD